MYSGVFQLPNLPRICPKKTGNKISPGFQEAKDGYEQWVKENITLFLSIVSPLPHIPKIVLRTRTCEETSQVWGTSYCTYGVTSQVRGASACTYGGTGQDGGTSACSTCVAQGQL